MIFGRGTRPGVNFVPGDRSLLKTYVTGPVVDLDGAEEAIRICVATKLENIAFPKGVDDSIEVQCQTTDWIIILVLIIVMYSRNVRKICHHSHSTEAPRVQKAPCCGRRRACLV